MIVALEEAKYKLVGMRPVVAELGNALRIDEQKIKIEELEAQTLDADFWSNQENSSKVLQAIKQAKEYGHSVKREVGYLTIHSMLHLLGYDHLDEAEQKAMMRTREEAIAATIPGLSRE